VYLYVVFLFYWMICSSRNWWMLDESFKLWLPLLSLSCLILMSLSLSNLMLLMVVLSADCTSFVFPIYTKLLWLGFKWRDNVFNTTLPVINYCRKRKISVWCSSYSNNETQEKLQVATLSFEKYSKTRKHERPGRRLWLCKWSINWMEQSLVMLINISYGHGSAWQMFQRIKKQFGI
jgi:hypothetical protein